VYPLGSSAPPGVASVSVTSRAPAGPVGEELPPQAPMAKKTPRHRIRSRRYQNHITSHNMVIHKRLFAEEQITVGN
jgi:hypothetical protein